ncbi:MAG TPA: ferritin-like domain-containing protein [Rhodanobacteraceae bacterium]|nr:ferritin-like domain-containing protein [Rhodanobacteraceae bacterium]
MSTARKEMNEHDPARENLLDWLRNAHAMEKQAEKMLEGQAKRLENYPEVKARIEQHITETKRQARDVEQCLKSLGEDTSALKDTGGKAMALMQAMGGMTMSDEVIKGAIASYAFEHMEVASYTVLIAAAHAAGETEVAHTCERILQEEKAMAAWLAEHTPAVVQKYLERERSGQQSKR